jgi:hypothetical protein
MRVLTLNIWKDEGDLAARLEMFVAECRLLQPDLVCLQEVYADATMDAGEWLADALGLTRVGVPARIKQRSGVLSSSGIAILSRLPLLTEESLDLPTSAADGGRKSLSAVLEATNGPIRVVSLHLSHLKADEGDILRQQQLAAIWSWASEGWDQYKLPYTIVRPLNCVGIGERRALGDVEIASGNVKLAMSHVVPDLIQKILRGQDPVHILGDGTQVRHYTYGGDLAQGIVLAMESEKAFNEDFNLSTSVSTTVLELAETIWTKVNSGKTLRIQNENGFQYDVNKRIPSVEKSKQILGFEATTSLSDMLDEVIPWIKKAIKEELI